MSSNPQPPPPYQLKSQKTGSGFFVQNPGRMPWYDAEGKVIQPYIIGIAGGSASGKTSVSQRILQHLGVPWVSDF
jgi:Phosphoribulokinase / Uridine kinase family